MSKVTRRLALYVPSLKGGGAERVMVTLANGLAARGQVVDLVLSKAEGPYLDDVAGNVRIIDLRSSRVLTSLPGLVRYLRREQPAVLLSALNHANVVALLAQRFAGGRTRVVISEHNNLSSSARAQTGWRGRLVPWFMRSIYPWANEIVAVSTGVADDLARQTGISRELITVIYNPVVTSDLFVCANEPVDHPWFAPREPPVILGVGRLTAQKGFDVLLQAFARLRQAHAARLMILGQGELRVKLETISSELGIDADVDLLGFQANPYAFMRQAALFVLSSRYEGLPTVLIEAMACGAPVVSTDCPSGPAEILENGKWGRLVAVGNVEELTRAMLQTLTEPKFPDVTQRAQAFTVANAVDGYLRVLLGEDGAGVGV